MKILVRFFLQDLQWLRNEAKFSHYKIVRASWLGRISSKLSNFGVTTGVRKRNQSSVFRVFTQDLFTHQQISEGKI